MFKTLYVAVPICGKCGAFETKRRHHLRHCCAEVAVCGVAWGGQGDSLSSSRVLRLPAVDKSLVKVK